MTTTIGNTNRKPNINTNTKQSKTPRYSDLSSSLSPSPSKSLSPPWSDGEQRRTGCPFPLPKRHSRLSHGGQSLQNLLWVQVLILIILMIIIVMMMRMVKAFQKKFSAAVLTFLTFDICNFLYLWKYFKTQEWSLCCSTLPPSASS